MGSARHRNTFTSFAMPVIVTFTFLVALVVTLSHSAAVAQNAGLPTPILSTEDQKTLLNLMAIHGHDVALDSSVTAALGLSRGNEVLTLRQLTVTDHDEPHDVHHTYIPLADGGVLLIYDDLVKAASSYRLDMNLKLVAAVVIGPGPSAPTVIPVPDAERQAQAELAYWAALANNPLR
jgi:hypothetical protein